MSDRKSGDYLPEQKHFSTSTIHNFQEPEQWDSMALTVPLVLSTNFKHYTPGKFKKFVYGRDGNPNREILEKSLAELDNGKYGLCWSSGMAAISAVAHLLKQGDHVVCEDDVYETTGRLFRDICCDYGVEVTFADENTMESAIKPNTKMIWIESLSNPTMKVMDVKRISEIAHKNNALLVIDNTFMSPYFHRPLDFGADIVVHSLTKYINGHGDVVMGATITNNTEINKKLHFFQETMGPVPSPFDCYLVTRSLKTLSLRMREHMKNSLAVAKFLEKHPKIEKVLHPGLPCHPQHELFKKQTSGCSGMMAFYLKNAGLQESQKFLTSLKVFILAESLGGCESLAELPSLMTHVHVPDEKKKILNITDNLIRLSVGLENVDDLISDLETALEKI